MFSTVFTRAADSVRVPVVALRPGTAYSLAVEAIGPGGIATSAAAAFTTGQIPEDLWPFRVQYEQLLPSGFILTTVRTVIGRGYVVAFDNRGEIAWYRSFPEFGDGAVSETKQQPNGNITVFVGNTSGFGPTYGRFVEITYGGEIVRTHAAAAPYYTDNHELLLTGTGDGARSHLFGYELRRVNLSAVGGAPDVLLAGHQILRQTTAGTVEFLWNAWDHVPLQDWIEEPQSLKHLANIDFDHPNSLTFDRDGHYIASFRGLGQVMKVNANDASIIWRFGGRQSDFQIQGDPLGFFSGQHSVSVLPNGNLLIYDNGLRHSPPQSRVVEYSLDRNTNVATMVWEYRHSPAIYTPFLGFTERLSNGNTFIGWGGAGVMTEVTSTGSVVWEATLRNGSGVQTFYRARRIPSLERYQRP